MKKFRFIIFVIILITALAGGAYTLQQRRVLKVISPEATVTTTPPVGELLTWEDPAGFMFQYPKEAQVNKHDEDSQNYAHIELTQKDNPGTIIVWAKDTNAVDSASWVKAEKSLSGGTVFDTSLAGISGKKVLLTTPKKTVVSGIVDEGVVFYVEGVFDSSEYWTKAYDAITSSFSFSSAKQNAPPQAGAAAEDAVDEEEIIE